MHLLAYHHNGSENIKNSPEGFYYLSISILLFNLDVSQQAAEDKKINKVQERALRITYKDAETQVNTNEHKWNTNEHK